MAWPNADLAGDAPGGPDLSPHFGRDQVAVAPPGFDPATLNKPARVPTRPSTAWTPPNRPPDRAQLPDPPNDGRHGVILDGPTMDLASMETWGTWTDTNRRGTFSTLDGEPCDCPEEG